MAPSVSRGGGPVRTPALPPAPARHGAPCGPHVLAPRSVGQLHGGLALLHQVVHHGTDGREVENQGRGQAQLELLRHLGHQLHAGQAVHPRLHEGTVRLQVVVAGDDVLHHPHQLLLRHGGVQALRLRLGHTDRRRSARVLHRHGAGVGLEHLLSRDEDGLHVLDLLDRGQGGVLRREAPAAAGDVQGCVRHLQRLVLVPQVEVCVGLQDERLRRAALAAALLEELLRVGAGADHLGLVAAVVEQLHAPEHGACPQQPVLFLRAVLGGDAHCLCRILQALDQRLGEVFARGRCLVVWHVDLVHEHDLDGGLHKQEGHFELLVFHLLVEGLGLEADALCVLRVVVGDVHHRHAVHGKGYLLLVPDLLPELLPALRRLQRLVVLLVRQLQLRDEAVRDARPGDVILLLEEVLGLARGGDRLLPLAVDVVREGRQDQCERLPDLVAHVLREVLRLLRRLQGLPGGVLGDVDVADHALHGRLLLRVLQLLRELQGILHLAHCLLVLAHLAVDAGAQELHVQLHPLVADLVDDLQRLLHCIRRLLQVALLEHAVEDELPPHDDAPLVARVLHQLQPLLGLLQRRLVAPDEHEGVADDVLHEGLRGPRRRLHLPDGGQRLVRRPQGLVRLILEEVELREHRQLVDLRPLQPEQAVELQGLLRVLDHVLVVALHHVGQRDRVQRLRLPLVVPDVLEDLQRGVRRVQDVFVLVFQEVDVREGDVGVRLHRLVLLLLAEGQRVGGRVQCRD
mmetsp:Transcript_15266/g.43649  ORF Transcript_15266/g.43649 Transcript_15266/m.43649 type:complete len:742 (+) Transcript_15266:124-2349(+)